MPEFVHVAAVADIPPGTSRTVHVGDDAIAVFNIDGSFHAIDNRCPHANAPLADGDLEDANISCPLHGWNFDVRTGECGFMPGVRVHCYRTEARDGSVFVEVGTRPY